MESYMNFKEVELTDIPVLAMIRNRLAILHPTFKPLRAGKDFDADIYRIYVRGRIAIDFRANLLNDLALIRRGDGSEHASGLVTQLDKSIQDAFSPSRCS